MVLRAWRWTLERLPADFMFQLNSQELDLQFSKAKKGLRRPPYAFTEHGVAMLSSVLMRAFVSLRVSAVLLLRQIQQIYDYIQLLLKPEEPKHCLGFAPAELKSAEL